MQTVTMNNWKADVTQNGNLIVFGEIQGRFVESRPIIGVKGMKVITDVQQTFELGSKDTGEWEYRLKLKAPHIHEYLYDRGVVN